MKKVLSFIIFMMSGMSLCAAPAFSHLSTREGLPFSWINGIMKDADNEMWFTSIHGAYCYDGSVFEEYTFQDEETGLVCGVVSVWQSPDRTVYIGTDNGLFQLNKEDGSVIHTCLHGHRIAGLSMDTSGIIWIATSSGIYKTGPDSQPVICDVDSVVSPEIYFTSLLIDSGQAIWAGSINGKLYSYNHRTGSFSQVSIPVDITNAILDIYEDSLHRIWLSTEGHGAIMYDPHNGRVKEFDTRNGMLLHNLVRDVQEADDKSVWIATERGITVVRDDIHVEHIQSNGTPESLNDNAVYALYKDNEGNMWAGTFFGGVNVSSSRKSLFESILSTPSDYTSESRVVSSIETYHGNLLVGTENYGVFEVSPDGEILSQYSSGENGLKSNNIHSVCLDSNNNLWLGSYFSGLFMQRHSSGPFANITFTRNNIYKIYEDSKSNLWIGTQYDGLYRFDFSSMRPVRFPEGLPKYLFIWDIVEGRDGNIWLASYGDGVWKIDARENYKAEKIESPAVTCITISELADGRILVGTEKEGVVEINPISFESKSYSKSNGLFKDNTVYGVLQDDYGNIWLSTNTGLYMSDSSMSRFVRYSMEDGLPANRFNYNAAAKIDGKLLFGSINGVVCINQSLIGVDNFVPSINFDALYINSIKVETGSKSLPRRIQSLDKLVIGPGQNMLGLQFADYDYSNRPTHYSYRLTGLSSEWQAVGKQKRIDFSGLSHGHYVLEIAVDTNTQGRLVIKSLPVWIKPHWWQSNFAIAVYILILLAVIAYLVIQFQLSSRREHELEIERLQREKDKEVNEMKYRFFVNISHEFKKPISLILGPAEQLIAGDVAKEKEQRYLGIIKKNANKLLRLINELLTFREVQFAKLDLSIFNLNEFLTELASRYDWFSEAKGINISVSCDESIEIEADRIKLEKIVGNLLSNSIKYNHKNGAIEISACVEDDQVHFAVMDYGDGIDADKLLYVFERFFSGEMLDSYSSGVGLSYVKSLVELHSGTITIDSKKGEYTVVDFHIPLRQTKAESADTDDASKYKIAEEPYHGTAVPSFDEEIYSRIASSSSILIVDDDQTMGELLHDYLNGRYNVHICTSCENALEYVHSHKVDIIVTDVSLPGGMSGFDFCKYVKSDMETSHIKVIVMTVLSEDNYTIDAYRSGADSFISKPFNFSTLEQRIKNFLINSYFQQEAFKVNLDFSNLQVDANDADEQLVRKISSYVFDNIQDINIDVDTICSHVGMSKSTLYRKLKSITGQSINEFIQNIRITYSAKMLSDTKLSISEIAYMSGFTDPYYFSRAFKKYYEVSPKQWRVKNISKS